MDRCTGHCCAEFFLEPLEELKQRLKAGRKKNDLAQIIDMLIPLPNSTAIAPSIFQTTAYTCKHFDKETRRCLIYETRPKMCRDYGVVNVCDYKGCTWSGAKRYIPTGENQSKVLKEAV